KTAAATMNAVIHVRFQIEIPLSDHETKNNKDTTRGLIATVFRVFVDPGNFSLNMCNTTAMQRTLTAKRVMPHKPKIISGSREKRTMILPDIATAISNRSFGE